jgi:hypothetical protein
MEQNEDWDRRYLDMSLLEEWSALDDEMASAVLKMIERLRPSSEPGRLVAAGEPSKA